MAVVTWPTFESALLEREMVADGTMTFRWQKPADWDYRAGQFIDITLHDPPQTDAKGNTRGFSVSAAPCEGVIAITTRLGNTAFKRALQVVPLGTTMKLEGPFGDFRLHHADRPAVLLAGGIGITPFRSLLVQAVRCGTLPYPVTLFHANRRPVDAAFARELQELAAAEPKLRFVPTVTAPGAADGEWNGEAGHVDAAMLRRHVPDLHEPLYYIAGPPGMVQGTRAMLLAAGVSEDDLRSEEFTGYGTS